ncbi:uncharacterized protein LOC129966159 [Argiope bruennichi]|uniref:uncharacterized protein LOC129966159 n=1 Tax=Argiope bruennichi TaxID=94029 RepID=UPI00249532E5|nr:uncharacterized protein LOC129966159 [Argiope bruennichi]
MRVHIGWIVWSGLAWGVAAAETTCYPPGGVAGIVVATVIVTFVVGGLGAALLYRYWWAPRQKTGSRQRTDPPVGPSQNHKNATEFAFDNPYFRNNQDSEDVDETDKGKTKFTLNSKNSLRSSKSEGKTRKGKNPFGFGGGRKQKAMDDSCIAHMEPERTVVSLRGHDFTGLGFNIMGNMRDGILVKDVLHRGPASESGLIKAGDKIISVTVSFSNIVYEDALTILSYASPYDVKLELERKPSAPKRLGSSSFSDGGQKLFHPLYRSQSIDDLTQIDRELPRRSQSVGVAAHRMASKAEDREKMSLILSTTGSLNEKMLANVMAEGSGGHWKKKFEDSFESEDVPSTPLEREPSKRFLDGPQPRQKLEARSMEDEDVSECLRIRVTDENHRKEEQSSQSHREETGPARNRTTLLEDDNNDSDVSKDSLEISGRVYQKKKILRGSPLATPKGQITVTNTVQIENPTSSTTTRVERIYDRSSKPSSNPDMQQIDRTSYTQRDAEYMDNNRTRADPYRNVQKPNQNERQKLNTSEAFTQSYGCRTQNYNGGTDEHNRNLKYPNAPSSSSYNRHVESDDNRKIDSSIESQPKFTKKGAPNPAGGMFTQISPFQMPSNKQRQFRPWAGKEDLSSRPTPSASSGPKFTLRDSSIQHRQF